MLIVCTSSFAEIVISSGIYYGTSYNINGEGGDLGYEYTYGGAEVSGGPFFTDITSASLYIGCDYYFPTKRSHGFSIGLNLVTFGWIEFPVRHFCPSLSNYLSYGVYSDDLKLSISFGFSYESKVYDMGDELVFAYKDNETESGKVMKITRNVLLPYFRVLCSGKRFGFLLDLRHWTPYDSNGFISNLDLGLSWIFNFRIGREKKPAGNN